MLAPGPRSDNGTLDTGCTQAAVAPAGEATPTYNLAIGAHVHGGAVCCQAAAEGQDKTEWARGLPAPLHPAHPPPDVPVLGLPLGTSDVGGVAQKPGKVLVELFLRGPQRAQREAHAVPQTVQGVCRDRRPQAASSNTLALCSSLPRLCPIPRHHHHCTPHPSSGCRLP